MALVNQEFAGEVRARLGSTAEEVAAGLGADCCPAGLRALKVPEDVVNSAAAVAVGLPCLPSIADQPVCPDFLEAVPIGFARRHGLVGLSTGSAAILMTMADLSSWVEAQMVVKLLGRPAQFALAPRNEILQALNAAYQRESGQTQRLLEQLDGVDLGDSGSGHATSDDLLDVASRAPVIKLVSLLLLEAVRRQASDVHIQPYEDRLMIRLRMDGILRDMFEPPRALHEEIISRVKVMAGMNIAEHRLAQDGRATVQVGDRIIDLRVSTVPTSHGERAVIRLLDKSVRLYKLPDLGMPQGILGDFRRLIHTDHGIILVTGPTGSGKTTTLYAALQEINSTELNVLTLEDPIEYRLSGISQMQVNERKGMTFASGLRHVLRQDPDIVMVGEIRDSETAHMAIQSALTGHLVFSTLHTNDAAGAVARLLDLEVEPYLLASSLLGVLAQRLVRRICPRCKVETAAPAAYTAELAAETLPAGSWHRGTGCEACMQTGYSGRVGIFELLLVNEAIREQVLHRARASALKNSAMETGMSSLRADGLAKAAAGITTLDEVIRVTSRDEF